MTDDQYAALRRYADRHGAKWKERLINAWWEGTDLSGDDGHLLRQIRNQFGPNWLKRFRFREAA